MGEAASTATLNVLLSAASPVTVTVNYATSNGTATAGSDYSATSGTLTFAPGVSSLPISMPILNDLSDEPNETLTLTLSAPSGARLATPSAATITITDDDATPTVAWQTSSVSVGEAAGSALVTAVLSAPAAATVTVNYATSNGTASAGSDYTAKSGTFSFAPGVTSQSTSITILNDALTEPNETVTLTLSAPANATLGSPNPATLTILDDETAPPPTETYETYDALGNLIKHGLTNYGYGANGNGTGAGPHQARTVGGQAYSYDANGNLLSGGGRTYTWDHENRPSQIVSGTLTETYAYDGDGERISRTSGGTTTIYLQGSWEETTTGAVKAYYTLHGATVAVRDSVTGVAYLHADHLGSVSVTSGAGAALLSRQAFGPWGTITSGGVSQTALNFTGQRLDSGTGLLYYHARYYDPALARFVSADTIVPGQADKAGTPNPQNLNRYSYVLNNPVTKTDPSGHYDIACPECHGGGGGGGGGTISEPPPEEPPSALAQWADNATQAIENAANTAIDAVVDLVTGPSEPVQEPQLSNTSTQARDLADKYPRPPGEGDPRTVAVMETSSGAVYEGRSGSDYPMHPKTQAALDEVPPSARSPYHGNCAEIHCINQAYASDDPVAGANISTARVRGPNSPQHGEPIAPCSSCRHVLKQEGINYR